MFGLNEAILSILTNIRNWNTENTSVVYPIYQRTGDKSDGHFNPTSNVTLTKNAYQWDTVNIPSGVTITAKAPGLLILANTITIAGLLTASGLGGAGGAGTADNTSASSGADGCGLSGGGGGGGAGISVDIRGGAGGDGRATGAASVGAGAGTTGNSDVDAMFSIASLTGLKPGGGGGGSAGASGYPGSNGGNGGGYIIIVCKNFVLTGAIRAEGLNGGGGGTRGGGGGGGGVIVIDALSIQNTGTLSVAGGAGGTGSNNAGGAGGTGCKLIVVRGLR